MSAIFIATSLAVTSYNICHSALAQHVVEQSGQGVIDLIKNIILELQPKESFMELLIKYTHGTV